MQVEKGKERVETLMNDVGVLGGSRVWASLFDGVLGDRAKVMEESQLPQTGMPASIEQELSSIFVEPFQLKVPHSPVLRDAQCMCTQFCNSPRKGAEEGCAGARQRLYLGQSPTHLLL